MSRGGGGGEGAYSFVACLSHLTIDHASLSRRSTVPTPNRDTPTSNIWALSTLLPYTTYARSEYHTQLAKMSFDKIFQLKYSISQLECTWCFNFYNITSKYVHKIQQCQQ